MPRLVNAFRGADPIAKAIGDLGKTLYGDQVSGALKREKLLEAQRINTETGNLAAVTGQAGAQNLGDSPLTQALLVASGFSPKDYAQIGLMGASSEFGAEDPRTANAQIGAGQPFRNTARAFYQGDATDRRGQDIQSGDRRYAVDQRVGEDRRQFDTTPVEAVRGGAPAFVRRADAFGPGVQPILNENEVKGFRLNENFGDLGSLPAEEQRVLDADPTGSIFNYRAPDGANHLTRGGVRDLQTGQELPHGGFRANVQGTAEETGLANSTRAGLEKSTMAADRFIGLSQRVVDLTNQDPTLFGPAGAARSLGQNMAETVDAFRMVFGGDPGQLARKAREDIVASGVNPALLPEVFDPNLPKVQLLGGLMAYSGASTLAGQEGRDLSNQDLQFWRKLLGDPQSLFTSAREVRTKALLAQEVVREHRRLASEYLSRGIPIPKNLAEAAQANVLSRQEISAPPAAPAPGGAAPDMRFERGPDGNIVRVR